MNNKTSGLTARVKQWIPIGLIVLLATGLRFYQLSTESLWVDEMFSIRAAENFNPLSTRPVYFALLGFWMQFGTSDAWLRTLAVLFGIGAVLLTYLLGRRVAKESIALISALIMAIAPLAIWHSQEIRMYSLSTFLTLGGTLALTYALEKPRYSSIAWWAVARLFALLTTPLNMLLLLPDTIIFGWKYRQQRRWLIVFGIGLLFIAIFWFPSAWKLATVSGPAFMEGHVAKKPKPDLTEVITTLTAFIAFWPLSPIKSSPISLSYYLLFTLMLVGLLSISVYIAWKHRNRAPQLLWLLAWAFLPSASILVISYIKSPIWGDRYLLFVSPYIFILLAAGFKQVWQWQRNIGVVLAIVYLLAVGGGLGHYYTTLDRNDWHGVEEVIRSNEKPGDVIVYYAPWPDNDESLTRYYQGDTPFYHIDRSPKIETWGNRSVEKELSKVLPIKSRLWLLCWLLCDEEDMAVMQRTFVGEDFKVEIHKTFQSPITKPIEVFLLTPSSETSQEISPEG
jgi:mannosyltransferase